MMFVESMQRTWLVYLMMSLSCVLLLKLLPYFRKFSPSKKFAAGCIDKN